MITKEIEDIEREIAETNLGARVEKLVEDWKENKRSDPENPGRVEIRNFVTASLSQKPERPPGRLFIRYSVLAAAIIAGAIFMVRVLSPGDPQKLFSEYYRPFEAVTEVTRSTDAAGSFTNGINSYRNGNYSEAAMAFSESLQKDPSSLRAHYFLGITSIATGEYVKAAEQLRLVAGADGEYSKEAKWYLGLALIQEGDTDGAKENFKALAESSGYYSERAAAILRRLK